MRAPAETPWLVQRMSLPVCAAGNVRLAGTVKVLGTLRGCRSDRGARAIADDPAKTATVRTPAAASNANTLRLAVLLMNRYYGHPAPPSHKPLGETF